MSGTGAWDHEETKSVLIIGGPRFVGRAMIDLFKEKNYKITMFNRGKTNADEYPEIERITGDRDGEIANLGDRKWENQNENEGDDQKDSNKDQGEQKNKNQKPEDKNKNPNQGQPGKLSPQQIKNLLEAMNNEEQKVQDKMNLQKVKGAKVKRSKDW